MTDSTPLAQPPRPRLLLVAPFFYPRDYGGVARLYDALVSRITRLDVTVLAESHGADPAALEAFDHAAPVQRGYRVVRVPNLILQAKGATKLGTALGVARAFHANLRSFRRAVSEINPDILLCGNTWAAGWMLNRMQGRYVHVNCILGEELTSQPVFGPVSTWLFRQQPECMKRARLNLAISRFTASHVVKATGLPESQVVMFPNAIDTKWFAPLPDRHATRDALGWNDHTVILTVARLVPRKGVDQTLRALAGATRLPENWLYIIGGRGPQEPALRDLAASLGIADRVRFLGFVPDEDLPRLYGAADLFVQTNRAVKGDTEGFGIVYVEANSCGTPVIGGISGGTADAIDEGVTGLRVDGDDVPAIERALESLLADPAARAAMGAAGRRRALAEFDQDVCARRLEDILLSLLN